MADRLLEGGMHIVAIDAAALGDVPLVFVGHIKRQFPDLVILVAGHRDAELGLASLISDGRVYRFIHKPLSAARARLFADAAVARYEEQHPGSTAGARAIPAKPLSRRLWMAAALAAGAVAMAAIWPAPEVALEDRPPTPVLAGAKDARLASLLDRATAALAANRLTEPPGDNALTLFREAQARRPADPEARAGLAEVRERLIAKVENALLEDHPDDAAAALEAARSSGVDGGRVTFLTAQIAKTRATVGRMAAAARRRADAAVPSASDGPGHSDRTQPTAGTPSPAPAAGTRKDAAPASAAVPVSGAASPTNAAGTAGAAAVPGSAGAANGAAGDPSSEVLRRQPETAPRQADEAAALGYTGSDLAPLQRELDAAAAARALEAQVVTAGSLRLLKSVKPAYPVHAQLNRIEGWVELDFTVSEQGAVRDVAIHDSSRPGVFDRAAIGALSQWRYEPVLRDAKPVPQRARIRIRFTLAG